MQSFANNLSIRVSVSAKADQEFDAAFAPGRDKGKNTYRYVLLRFPLLSFFMIRTMSVNHRETKPSLAHATTPTPDLFRIDGRTVLITGGGGAVGLEAARAVLESGGDAICKDRQEKPLEVPWRTVLAASKKYGTRAWYYQCDVTNEENVRHVFKTSMEGIRFPFRGMVACAGISGDGATIDFPIDKAKRILEVNVTGSLICAQAASREFQQQGAPGSIVFIASMSGHISNKGLDTAAYNSSKSAVVQMARSLAAEWGSRAGIPLIRVNTVSPGYIRTRMSEASLKDPEIEKKWMEDNMLMRLSEAHEYRGAIVFLLSDASSFMTGSDIKVDGGHTAW
ncbi:D-arabinitol 2-dehydrogenase [Colletotrichum karsti]|uniref:D-arabinitol 2-dehydrogenase n=1 Tax=Colletotrichum karsti TaxID=1095194 RepID=A0A9P6LFD3_9PEZI|nr:D-arabinitol 2-dehydrogenase [Colletotrichum karsti]KAF9871066.1 D-arabinitol 2-dehydrogenase [Colletotrichum karsti]